jgi:hypothetical protein
MPDSHSDYLHSGRLKSSLAADASMTSRHATRQDTRSPGRKKRPTAARAAAATGFAPDAGRRDRDEADAEIAAWYLQLPP